MSKRLVPLDTIQENKVSQIWLTSQLRLLSSDDVTKGKLYTTYINHCNKYFDLTQFWKNSVRSFLMLLSFCYNVL